MTYELDARKYKKASVCRSGAARAALCLAAAVLLGVSAPASGEEFKMLPRPQYKLYTMCSGKMTLSEEDISRIARNFEFSHGKFSREQNDAIRKINPNFKCLTYINSTYTRSVDDVRLAESKYRNGLCMLLAARLAEPIDAGQTRFRVAPPREEKLAEGKPAAIPIRASTIEGDFSSADAAKPSTKYYVFWIRIGDELMRVNKFDPAGGEIEVSRGFSASKPAGHKAGDNVFSPVYLGYKRTAGGPAKESMNDDADDDPGLVDGPPGGSGKEKYPGEHPGGPGSHLRYVLDPSSNDGNLWRAQQALAAMLEDGVDGVWMDTFNCGTFNLGDCLGRKAHPWNFTRNQAYDFDDFRLGQEKKVAFIQEFVKAQLGKYPFLVANNLHNYEPGRGGMKLLLVPTQVKPRPLDGFCMEGGLAIRSLDGWKERIQLLMDAAQNGLAAMPIIGGAGAKSVLSEPDTPARDKAERFAYAGYLLAVEKDGKAMMGTYAFYQADGKRFVKVHPMYYYPIGRPAETVKPDQLDSYLLKGLPVYRRAFTNGLVLVNPSQEACTVDLGRSYVDPDARKAVTTVAMPAGTGKILLARLDD